MTKLIHWFKNYWYYYKFHTFAALFVLILAGVLIYQSVTSVSPDICVYFLTRDPIAFQEETTDNLEERIASYITDVNGDGQIRVEVAVYVMSDEYDENKRDDFVTEYVGGGIMLMIVDDYSMQYLQEQTYSGKNVSELTDDTSYDGEAWKINGSAFADCSAFKYLDYDLYFTLRRFNEDSWIQIIPGRTEEFSVAKNLLENIINNTPAEE